MTTHQTILQALIAYSLSTCALASISCPPMPDSLTGISRDINSDITATVGKLGPVKGGEIAIKTDVVAKALFDKYPNIDKLVALQTMASTYCNMLVSASIPDSDRLSRWEAFQERVLDLRARSTDTKPTIRPPIETKKVRHVGSCQFNVFEPDIVSAITVYDSEKEYIYLTIKSGITLESGSEMNSEALGGILDANREALAPAGFQNWTSSGRNRIKIGVTNSSIALNNTAFMCTLSKIAINTRGN